MRNGILIISSDRPTLKRCSDRSASTRGPPAIQRALQPINAVNQEARLQRHARY
jgi:hypothetical protein